MQELMVPAQSTSPYTPVGGGDMPNTPQLGTPVPGTTGGLPALSGLSVAQNPMAEQLQSMGRGEDSMLVHMTPNEVNSLRGLAQRFGGDLSVNPNTGLPEAGWLGKLLPTILGIAGAAFGIPTWAIGLGVGAGQTAITGDLGKGLSAGLQAFGGAGLGQAAGIGGKLGSVGADLGLTKSVTGGIGATTGAGGAPALGKAAQGTVESAFDKAFGVKTPGFLSRFGAETSLGQTGLIGKALPVVAGTSVLGGVSEAFQPKMPKYKGDDEESSWNYEGPYVPGKRQVSFQSPDRMRETGGAEATYFTPSNPVPGYRPIGSLSEEEQSVYGFADGGLASTPQANDFNALVASYQASNPGAITASMYPTAASPATPALPSPATAGREQTYSFQNRPTQGGSTTTSTSPSYNYGSINIPGIGTITLPDFSNVDWSQYLNQYGQTSQPTQQPSVADALSNLGYDPNNPPSQFYRNPMVADALSVEQPLTKKQAKKAAKLAAQPTAIAPVPEYPAFDWSQYTPQTYELPTPIAPTPEPVYEPLYSYDPYEKLSEMAVVNPKPVNPTARAVSDKRKLSYAAKGGSIDMGDGSFVVDARTVSELGNGSSNAGIDMLSRLGGRPVRGPGDGVSDSVPARIGGSQEARVARDEVIFPPEAVRRMGGGSEKKGTQKLYKLMERAHKARKKAARGQDTKLRRGLA